MIDASLPGRLAICSWSLQPATPADLIAHIDAIGIRRLQIALDPLRENPAWHHAPDLFARHGIELASGMFGTVGEDYTSLDSIRRTGGVVPDDTWDRNWRNIRDNADLAERLGLPLVTFHAGFLPHEQADPTFAKLFDRVARIADLFAGRGIQLGFETGQETAGTLAAFLQKLNRPAAGVNFDPANIILYDKGDPIDALRTLGPWLKQCHLKDARRTRVPGTWGEEVVVGTGQVDWPAFFHTLQTLGFRGNCCIEREAGSQRAADILAARRFVENLP